MIIGILGHEIFSGDDFIELGNGAFVILLHVISISQLIEISVVPFAFFAFIQSQIGNGFVVLFQVEIAFANDFVQFRLFNFIGFGHCLCTQVDCFLEIPQLEIHVGLVIRQFFLVFFFAGNFVKIFGGLLVIVAFIGHKTKVILGLRTVFLGIGDFIEIGRGLFFVFGTKKAVAFLKVVLVLFFITQIIFIDFFEPFQSFWIIALCKIIVSHPNISLVLFPAGWIIRNKVFHQHIGIGLIGSNGAIGYIKGTVGFEFFIGRSRFHFFENQLCRSILIVIVQRKSFVKIF